MHVMRLAACVVAGGCSSAPLLEHVTAPAGLARPLQITGNGEAELWSVFETHGFVAAIAHSVDYGETWTRIDVPQIDGMHPVQIGAHGLGRVWVTGTGPTGAPALVSITHTRTPIVDDYTGIFPGGTTDVVMRVEGTGPDPMLIGHTMPDETSVFVHRDFGDKSWYRVPLPGLESLVSIRTFNGAYFRAHGVDGDFIEFCAVIEDATPCLDVPELDARAPVYGSVGTPESDFLWTPDPTGGTIVARAGGDFVARHVAEWPDDLEPLRFVALASGGIGMIGRGTGELVWVAFDEDLRITRRRSLGSCDDGWALDRASVQLLRDDIALLPTSDGWYIGAALTF